TGEGGSEAWYRAPDLRTTARAVQSGSGGRVPCGTSCRSPRGPSARRYPIVTYLCPDRRRGRGRPPLAYEVSSALVEERRSPVTRPRGPAGRGGTKSRHETSAHGPQGLRLAMNEQGWLLAV